MRRIRVIPILLLANGGLVKTVRFKKPNYIGDPINAVKIFNEKEVDELVILDIEKTRQNATPDFEHIRDIVSEAFMPIGYGGGIRSMDDIKRVIDCGIEKVVVNTIAWEKPHVIEEGAKIFGAQSMVVSVDYSRNMFGQTSAFIKSGGLKVKLTLEEYTKRLEAYGAGEIVLTSIDREGTYTGYDLEMITRISHSVSIPVVANGGARDISDFLLAVQSGASAVAAGSRFVYSGKEHGILINYPSQAELYREVFSKF